MAAALKGDAAEFVWAAEHLGKADKAVQRGLRRELGKVGKPVGHRILQALGAAMPHRGGLSARVLSQGKVSILTSLRGGKASVNVALRNTGGMYMAQFERGQVRHPVYGRWLAGQKPQTVPADTGKAALEKEAGPIAEQIATVATNEFWKAIQ